MEVLRAARIVLKNQKVSFTLAGSFGSKSFEKEVRTYILKYGLEEFVNLPGKVVGEAKANLFNSSDIFVFPTYYERETFAIVNVEAMSYGLPVISSDEGAIPEIVKDGINGFIVDPKSPEKIAQKIHCLANDQDLRTKMGCEGKKFYKEKYSYTAHAKILDRALLKFFEFAKKDKFC